MTSPSPHDAAHLVALIAAAREEAVRLGSEASPIVADLEAALAGAQARLGQDVGPDEGVRLQDLTTANDR